VPKTGLDALLRPEDSILVLIDHQPYQFANLHSHEPTMVVNNVIGLAKTAKVFNVPTILTTVVEERGGYLIKGLQDVFPEQKPINRTFINTWQDERVVEIVKKSGRKQVVLAALWTEICLAMPTIQALAEGYDVFIVADASGGVTVEAHDMAVRRLVAAGAVPITWLAVAAEWQRDWAREKSAIDLAGVVAEHGGASGVAFAWEMQLLAGRAGGVPDMSTPSAPICIGYRGPLLAVRPEGANHQRGRISPGQLSIGREAGEWLGLREGDLCDALGSRYRSSSGGRFSHCEPAWLRPASKRAAM
jgi:nicotinamidase-related amidase